jgi:hypothetical protein
MLVIESRDHDRDYLVAVKGRGIDVTIPLFESLSHNG